MDWPTEFTAYAVQKLSQNLAQIRRCVQMQSDDELWRRFNAHCNSIGNLVLHLTGNVRQWVNAALGDEPFQRQRQAEFDEAGPLPADEVLGDLEQAVRRACAVIRGLDAERLLQRHRIQEYDVSALQAVFHVVEHFSLHCGQIVQMTKQHRNTSLSQYDSDGRKLNGTAGVP